jgi:hypothetical protein
MSDKYLNSVIKVQSLVRRWRVLRSVPKQCNKKSKLTNFFKGSKSIDRANHIKELLNTEVTFIETLTILVNVQFAQRNLN